MVKDPSRRQFLRTSAAGATLAALSSGAYARIQGANERIHFAVVGLGVMGGGHLSGLVQQRKDLNIDVVQACDVYRRRAERTAQRAGKECAATQNYEDVLGNKNVHAVLIATPDHWHAKMAIDCIRAGKHVYLEKPMCHTIEQALELQRVEQASRGQIRVQVGVQGTSSDLHDRVREVIQKNGIGRLVMINGSSCRNNTAGQWRDYGEWENISDPQKAGIDWDLWLGHRFSCAGQTLAPRRPWDARRFFQFRCYWDYSGGIGSDLFFHTLTPILKVTDLQFPERVTAGGGIWVFGRQHQIPPARGGGADDREVPDIYHNVIDYPGGPTVTLIGCMANDTRLPTTIAGHDATITYSQDRGRSEAVIEPQRATGRIKERITLQGSPGGQPRHRANFVQAMRDPKVQLVCPVSLGLRTNVAITLGVRAYRERKVLGWDVKESRVIG